MTGVVGFRWRTAQRASGADPYDLGASTGFVTAREGLRQSRAASAATRAPGTCSRTGAMEARHENRVTLDPKATDAWGVPGALECCAATRDAEDALAAEQLARDRTRSRAPPGCASARRAARSPRSPSASRAGASCCRPGRSCPAAPPMRSGAPAWARIRATRSLTRGAGSGTSATSSSPTVRCFPVGLLAERDADDHGPGGARLQARHPRLGRGDGCERLFETAATCSGSGRVARRPPCGSRRLPGAAADGRPHREAQGRSRWSRKRSGVSWQRR